MVGQAIATKLVALGHEVKMGSREAGMPLWLRLMGSLGTPSFNIALATAG
jgi:hypothetical protein